MKESTVSVSAVAFVVRLVTFGAIVVGLVSFGAIVVYTVQNDSGHTGFNPYLALAVFIPVVGAGCAALCLKRRSSVWPGIVAIGVGCAGVALLVCLDQGNILLEYEVWIDRGMPALRGDRV